VPKSRMNSPDLETALQHHQSGRLAEALSIYRQLLADTQDDPEVLHLLGYALYQSGKPLEGLPFIERGIGLNPSSPIFHCNHGVLLAVLHRDADAASACRRATELRPNFPEAWYNLGNALRALGRLPEAIDAYRRSLQQRPGAAYGHNNLGIALLTNNQVAEAVEEFRAALAIQPDIYEAAINLGNALYRLRRFEESTAAFREAMQLGPDQRAPYENLAVSLAQIGELDESLATFRAGMAKHPSDWRLQSGLVYMMHFHPKFTPVEILREHADFDRRHCLVFTRAVGPHLKDPDPVRRLRIGYVSPDFRDHVIGRNILPILREHDHANFEIFCYSNNATDDALTPQFRKYSDAWRDIGPLDDDQAAELMRADGIDILLDLAMHLARSRPMLLARKPAPVQVCWAAYPSTTGLTAIDYRLTDPYLDPPSTDSNYSEKSIRLPNSFWCYDPAAMQLDEAPPLNPPPALATGFITFGCLNNFTKSNKDVLSLWERVLDRLPNSRMIMMSPRGEHRRKVAAALNGRVEFVDLQSRADYLKTYHRIDLGLDTFPYNGHTTSLDALWMGVPVISLCGEPVVSRAGFSQTSNLGLASEFVAKNADEFVELAVNWASDLSKLAQMRASLRDRFRKSPLTDAAKFTRGIESAYRTIWQTWCGQRS
jgi:protein O-GlcNAc transferase